MSVSKAEKRGSIRGRNLFKISGERGLLGWMRLMVQGSPPNRGEKST